MKIEDQIAAAYEARTQARATEAEMKALIVKRLDIAARIVKSVQHKHRFYGLPTQSDLAWVDVYRKTGAVVEANGFIENPVWVTLDATRHSVPRIFLYGSDRDIASEVRRIYYRAQYFKFNVELRSLEEEVNNAEAFLAKKIEAIHQDAMQQVEVLMASNSKDLRAKAILLETRKRQVAKAREWATRQDGTKKFLGGLGVAKAKA